MKKELSPYKCFLNYTAIKKHLTSPTFDYREYDGYPILDIKAFNRNADKKTFYQMAARNNPRKYILANLVENPNRKLVDFSEDRYFRFVSVRKSFTYHFKLDIRKLDLELNDLITNAQLMKIYLNGHLNPETIVMFDNVLKVFSFWNKNIQDKKILRNIKYLSKYSMLMNVETDKYKVILRDHFKTK